MKPDSGKPALTPKLRFPEFRDGAGWEDTILGSVLTEHGEKNDGASEVHSVSVHKGVINQIEHLGRSFAAADRSNYNLAKPHDIIYTKSPTGDFPWGVVKQNRLPYNVIVSPLYGVFSPMNRHLGYILDAYFESPIRTTNYLAPITQKGAKNTIQISNAMFLSKGLYLPSSEAEHKKIASFISSLDDLIGSESRKLIALKAHKKGLMQQLFPREGETVPRLRFPEFRKAGEWVYQPLRHLAKRVTTRNALLNNTRVLTNSAEFGIVDQGNYFEREIVTKSNLGSYYIVEKGDFVYNPRISTFAPVGPISRNNLGTGVMSPLYTVFRFMISSTDYFDQLFETTVWHRYLKEASNIGARHDRMSISTADFMNLPIPIPEHPEQDRIVTCLSRIDDIIAAQTNKHEALKTHKQGLMQQLFPFAEKAGA